MSQQELGLDWLKRAQDGTVTQKFAAEKMGITERWVRALLAGDEGEGRGGGGPRVTWAAIEPADW